MSDLESWKPDPAAADQVMQLLTNAQNPSSHEMNKQIYNQLEHFSTIDEFSKYLTYFLVNLDSTQSSYRLFSCIILKNTIKNRWQTLPDDVKEYIKYNIIRCLPDPIFGLREMIGSTISTIIYFTGVSNWKEVFNILFEYTQSTDENAIQGGYSCIEKICDDNQSHIYDDEISYPLIEMLIQNLGNESEYIRYFSIKSLLHMLPWKPDALMKNLSTFLQSVFNLAQYDTTLKVRKEICSCFSQLVESGYFEIKEFIHDIVRYMLTMTEFDDEIIALTASDYWKNISESDMAEYALKDFVDSVIPILFNGMRLSDEERSNFDYEDSNFDDQRFKKKKKADKWSMSTEDESADDSSEWTKRKACASGIDSMAKVFPVKMVECVLPLVEAKIQSEDWVDRESAVLLMGAISNGCKENLYPYLDSILPFIFNFVVDENAHMRCTACWTMSRYAKYIINHCEKVEFNQIYINLVLEVIKKDPSPSSKESALTSLLIYIDISGCHIVPYTTQILKAIMEVYPTLSFKNIVMCHENLEILATYIEEDMGRKEYLDIYLLPLMKRWESTDDDDEVLGNLLITLSSLVTCIGYNLHDLTETFYTRVYKIIHDYIVKKNLYINDPIKNDEPDDYNAGAAIDFLCGMCEGMHQSVMPYIYASPELPFIVAKLSEEKSLYILKSVFGLFGDLVRFSFNIFQPEFVQAILNNLIPQIIPRTIHMSVPNNAVWSLGEVLKQENKYIEPYLGELLPRFLEIIRVTRMDSNLFHITIITLGRLGIYFANQLGPLQDHDIQILENGIDELEDGPEREAALKGLMEFIRVKNG